MLSQKIYATSVLIFTLFVIAFFTTPYSPIQLDDIQDPAIRTLTVLLFPILIPLYVFSFIALIPAYLIGSDLFCYWAYSKSGVLGHCDENKIVILYFIISSVISLTPVLIYKLFIIFKRKLNKR